MLSNSCLSCGLCTLGGLPDSPVNCRPRNLDGENVIFDTGPEEYFASNALVCWAFLWFASGLLNVALDTKNFIVQWSEKLK